MIGTGNVAYHILSSFQSISTLRCSQVFNHRDSKEAKLFSKNFKINLVTDYAAINTLADVYIIAVKDDAIAEVVKNLRPLNLKGLVVHTSGSVSLSLLNGVSLNSGVYYPLQTFYKGAVIDWQTTPVLIEGNSKKVIDLLKGLGKSVSRTVKIVNSLKRLEIHLAAIFACNFTNAMYVSAYELIENNLSKKDTDILLPIMQQSFQKLHELHPKRAQTGPAMRGDEIVMKKHLALLKNNSQLRRVYKTLSDLIITQQKSH